MVRRAIGMLALTALVTLIGHSPGHPATRARSLAETVVDDMSVRLAGANHTCLVNEDGTASCWGNNSAGQLGDGTTTLRLTPGPVSGLSGAVAITTGGVHTCALLSDGTARCWGSNHASQIGDGATALQRRTPVSVSGLTNAVAIAAGSLHTCALLAGGTARCWGDNSGGQLGDGTATQRQVPVTVLGLANAVALVAGFSHTCALLADGRARCWGGNSSGVLGDGTTARRLSPVDVIGLTNAVRLAAGFAHTCALLADGTARCWGANEGGQLGDGTTTKRLTSVSVIGLTRAAALTAGDVHTCARLADGSARCWGRNDKGQLGDGSTTQRLTPVAVSGLTNAVTLAGGIFHTCALLADGSARCWGNNQSGQLGDATQSRSLTPRAVVGVAGSVTGRDITGGGVHTCAVRANGTVACWGYNALGQVGDDTTTNRRAPTAVGGLTNAVAVVGGFFHSCALLAGGTVRCWGGNASGQLGDGTTTDRVTPVAVSGLTNVVSIAAAVEHTCALVATGTVLCWGANGSGQLGNGGTASRLTPTPVSGVSNAVALAGGGFGHTCALLATGTGRCWGGNASGQLGDGTTITRLTPVAVTGLDSAVALAVGSAHTCALRADGSVRCWGDNASGQLGDGTTTPKFAPSAVPGFTNAVALGIGNDHTCVLVATGGARCWGDNASGQLGDGTRRTRLSPTIVTAALPFRSSSLPLNGAVQIAVGGSHTCALISNGGVRCWGDNDFGQIGDNTAIDRLRAVAVPSFALNIDPLVTVDGDPRVAAVTVLAVCEDGEELRVDVTLAQGAVSGHGSGGGECTGALERYPVAVTAHGPDGFVAGPAQVQAEGLILEDGVVVDTQEWTREVQIVSTRPSLAGSASGVGTGTDTASLRLTGQLTAAHSVALDQATLTLDSLLDEPGGAGELVRGGAAAGLLPLTLAARAGSKSTEAIYQRPSGVRPGVWAELKTRDPDTGVVEFSVKVDRATMPAGAARCSAGSPSTTRLRTRFTLQVGGAAPVTFDLTLPWRCLGTQLRSP